MVVKRFYENCKKVKKFQRVQIKITEVLGRNVKHENPQVRIKIEKDFLFLVTFF